MKSERDLVSWLQGQLPNIGDDVGLIAADRLGNEDWVITGDHQVPGVHLPDDTPPSVIAQRLLRVNLSDIAAGGGKPRLAFINVAVPSQYPLQEFMESLIADCQAHSIRLCGGDTTASPTAVFSLVILGDLPSGGRSPARHLAAAGDRVWIAGTVGQSLAGRKLIENLGGFEATQRALEHGKSLGESAAAAIQRHLVPTPQLRLGRWLAMQPRAAAIDLSDGLALDLHRMAEESKVGATIDRDLVPLARGFTALCQQLEVDPFEAALGGGEDYVLLFALPPEVTPPDEMDAVAIGALNDTLEIQLRCGSETEPLPAQGWDHLQKSC